MTTFRMKKDEGGMDGELPEQENERGTARVDGAREA
jgi:hypothetical protein